MRRGTKEELTLDLVTRDNKTGKVLGRRHIKCHSFMQPYYMFIEAFFTSAYNNAGDQTTIKDTGAVDRVVPTWATSNNSAGMAAKAAAADNTYGIQVGTGNAANGATTRALSTLIANGSGATQINYGGMSFTQPAGATPCSFTATRTFTNNSGAPIAITEAGFVIAHNVGGSARNFLVIRDVFAAVTVNDGNNTTATYTFSFTIS